MPLIGAAGNAYPTFTPRFAAAPAAPPSAPAPSCSAADRVQIDSLHKAARTARFNGTLAGGGIALISAICFLGGAATGGAICGGMAALVAFSGFNHGANLDKQAAALEARCRAQA